MLAYRREHVPFAYSEIMAFDWCAANYKNFDSRRINSLGLTDAILAHTDMQSDRPAHKLGLRPMAKDLERIQREAAVIRPGIYRDAVNAGKAPPWIEENLDGIEVMERKIYNNHSWGGNLRLVFSPRIHIQP